MKILELFGGIGACSKALKNIGVNYEIADYVEIDKYAVKSFNAIHGTNFEPQDICEWNKDLDVDLVMHGSPCQDFSLAGLQAGGDENSGTRSSLMYETVRIVDSLKPKYVIWENVKNVLSAKHKHNFDAYLEKMDSLGYKNYYQVLNAKDYGTPQNRERVFVVSIRKDIDTSSFEFPKPVELKVKLRDLLDKNVDEKWYLTEEQVGYIKNSSYHQNQRRIQEKDWCDTLCARDWKDPKCVQVEKLIGKTDIRKLTPKEYFKIMGFDDEDFEKASVFNSNTQLFKQAGNSICVSVLEAILKQLFGGEN
ncbi:MAG: DNA cytosine methyltransferase [Cellulosilyticum sp.]|nr:DNA cytosine methyltransferase [Cellulosilyticum sp.]